MPTYEYECQTCGSVFDVFQSIKATPLRKAECEKCGDKRPVKRLIGTGGAVIFKGTGFYQTDYRSEGYKKSAESESKSASDASTASTDTGSKKSEAKPAPDKSTDAKTTPKESKSAKKK